jgi:hypothetical protein
MESSLANDVEQHHSAEPIAEAPGVLLFYRTPAVGDAHYELFVITFLGELVTQALHYDLIVTALTASGIRSGGFSGVGCAEHEQTAIEHTNHFADVLLHEIRTDAVVSAALRNVAARVINSLTVPAPAGHLAERAIAALRNCTRKHSSKHIASYDVFTAQLAHTSVCRQCRTAFLTETSPGPTPAARQPGIF